MKSNGSGRLSSSLLGVRTQLATQGMSNHPDKDRREIEQRLSELRPVVEEYRCLQEVMVALGPVEESRSGVRSGVSSSRKRAPRGAGPGGSSDDAAAGDLVARVLSVVQANPSITVPKLANMLDAKPSDLYRILRELKRGGKVSSRRGWFTLDGSQSRDAPPARGRRP